MIIDYLGHSGFLVETERALLLFDYYKGDLSPAARRAAEKPLFVFASHFHKDHFAPEIFSLQSAGPEVRYLLSSDIRRRRRVPKEAEALFLAPDASYEVPGLGSVRTLRSTDEGVAFLVEAGGETIFHAGDLNWWDWEGEEPAWLAEQERVFKEEVAKLSGKRIDAAFVVLDDRLGERFAEGALHFLSVCCPRLVLPMHFWEDRSVVGRFRTLAEAAGSEAVILDTARETHWER